MISMSARYGDTRFTSACQMEAAVVHLQAPSATTSVNIVHSVCLI